MIQARPQPERGTLRYRHTITIQTHGYHTDTRPLYRHTTTLQTNDFYKDKKLLFAGPWPRACQIIVFATLNMKQQFETYSQTLQWKRQGNTFFKDKDSKSSHNFCNEQLRARTFAIAAASCSCCCCNCCFLFKPARARAAVREPPGSSIGTLFIWRGTFFSNHFLKPFFHTNITFWIKFDSKMDPFCTLRRAFFKENYENRKVCLDCTGVYGLHMSPSRGLLWATQKSKKNRNIFQNRFLATKIQQIPKKSFQKSPNGWGDIGGGASLAALGTLLVHQAVFWYPKWAPKQPNCSKSDPKVATYTPKGRPK